MRFVALNTFRIPGFFERSLREIQGHDRGPETRAEFEKLTEETTTKLEKVMLELRFFVQYPLFYVVDVEPHRRGTGGFVTVLRYMGDHPGLRKERIQLPTLVAKDTLFIDAGDKKWLSLFPYITINHCSNCKMREIFLIDRWRGEKDPALLKSFERGHVEKSAEVARELLDKLNPSPGSSYIK